MVRREEKPSFLAASCCSVLVVNGAPGRFRRCFFSTLVTTNGSFSSSATTCFASASLVSCGLCPSIFFSSASNACPSLAQSASMRPVLLRHEGADLPLPLDDQAEGHGLHPPGGEPGLDALPEDRARLVAHQPVEDAAGLLRVHLPVVDPPGSAHRLLDRVLGDLVEQHPVGGRLGIELVGHVPGDRLALAIGVGGQVDGARRLGRLLELGQRLGLSLDGDVLGLEPVVDVHAELAGRQVAQVADRRLHVVAAAQVLADASWPWWATRR